MQKLVMVLCIVLSAGVCIAAAQDGKSDVKGVHGEKSNTRPIAASKAIGIVQAVRELPDSIKTPNRYALVIGVGRYIDERIPRLPACSNDAKKLYDVLTDPSVGMFSSKNVTLLLDEKVTRDRVVDVLDMLSRKAGKDDLVLVFFSGHGACDERNRSYWVMHDSRIDRLRTKALLEEEITGLLGEIKTNRLVTFIDTCYSASTAELGRSKSLVDLKKIYPKFAGEGRVAITASKGDQLSVVISDKNHPGRGYSAFTWHLIKALKGEGDTDKDGVVTVDEVWDFVKDSTEATARQQGGDQQPQLKGQIGSRFMLTINAENLAENKRQTAEMKLKKEARLKKLEGYLLGKKMSPDIYQISRYLLKAASNDLDEIDRAKLAKVISAVDGRLDPGELELALYGIETPAQRIARMKRRQGGADTGPGQDGEEAIQEEDTNAFCFTQPAGTTVTINGKMLHLDSKPTVYLKKGTYYFTLGIKGDNDTIYGKLNVKIVNDDTKLMVFGKQTAILFEMQEIKGALEGRPVRKNIYLRTSKNSKICVASYSLGLRRLK